MLYRPSPFHAEQLRLLLAAPEGYPSEVGERLRWFLHFAEQGSVSATCREFGIARTTFYRWAKRFDPADLRTLVDLPLHPAAGMRRWELQGRSRGDAAGQAEPGAACALPRDSESAGARWSLPDVQAGRSVVPSVSGDTFRALQEPTDAPMSPASAPACPHPRCLLCRLRSLDWKRVRSALFFGSVAANVAFVSFLAAAVLLEFRSASASVSSQAQGQTKTQAATSLAPAPQP